MPSSEAASLLSLPCVMSCSTSISREVSCAVGLGSVLNLSSWLGFRGTELLSESCATQLIRVGDGLFGLDASNQQAAGAGEPDALMQNAISPCANCIVRFSVFLDAGLLAITPTPSRGEETASDSSKPAHSTFLQPAPSSRKPSAHRLFFRRKISREGPRDRPDLVDERKPPEPYLSCGTLIPLERSITPKA